MCCNQQGRDIPFLEQVDLFAETMNERFIQTDKNGKGNGRCLLIFASDTTDANADFQQINVAYGGKFDLALTLSKAFNEQEIMLLLSCAEKIKSMNREK